nr:MAG TPA: hypothetical protein [Caudoviricetes sp.]DAY89588.1 MAG TPA: hypothetical protein [Caudoviricetes sp.]
MCSQCSQLLAKTIYRLFFRYTLIYIHAYIQYYYIYN